MSFVGILAKLSRKVRNIKSHRIPLISYIFAMLIDLNPAFRITSTNCWHMIKKILLSIRDPSLSLIIMARWYLLLVFAILMLPISIFLNCGIACLFGRILDPSSHGSPVSERKYR